MGLTNQSTGRNLIDEGLVIKKQRPDDRVIALAGNPNVGKSTVFNQLTGLHQHTGNWPGKTVSNAQGCYQFGGKGFVLVDLPGCYSLMAHSAEEECARDFICFGDADAVVVVCDATCLERNLNLVLQTLEITSRVVVCVNLMDEANRKNIEINIPLLARRLGVPVVATSAAAGEGLEDLMKEIERISDLSKPAPVRHKVTYDDAIEKAIALVEPVVASRCLEERLDQRWAALRFLDSDEVHRCTLAKRLNLSPDEGETLERQIERANALLEGSGINSNTLKDRIVSGLIRKAEEICKRAVVFHNQAYHERDRKLDRILTSRRTGFLIMFLLLVGIFWITITGANYPSQVLSSFFTWLEPQLVGGLVAIGCPVWLYEMLIYGVYRVLTWVISVMLPPMAIFFPLFTLLEDLGYLPRIAFNLDRCFRKCAACGKQALTMAMGFGCNAAGIVGCRIIDSPRERLIAMLTNNFVPCNGRFPTLISILTMFFVGSSLGMFSSVASAVLLAGLIVLGILMTFVVSKILSVTVLKGVPSSFTLELPPYRRPQVGKIIVRSLLDRTLFVLGRAATVAIPAGLIIWILANVQIEGTTLLTYCSSFLDPFARLLGLDGVILMAFILGFPANEIVIPLVIMAYTSQGALCDISDLGALHQLLTDNGWTWITAVSTMLFSLMHWPCSTTLLTIKKESQSVGWTLAAFFIPTVCGVVICFLFATVARLF